MVLPILFYGNPILRKKCSKINRFSYYYKKKINNLIKNMFDTLHKVKGIGLAAPQIGKNINLFIVDTPYFNGYNIEIYKEVFINSKIIKTYGKKYKYNEGCLSIPGVICSIKRKSDVYIEYYNKYWEKKSKTLTGIRARVILHEYDHIKGKLFIDYLSSKKIKLIKKKLIFIMNKQNL